VLAVGRKYRKLAVTRDIPNCALQPFVVPIDIRQMYNCKMWRDGVAGTFYQIYLVISHLIILGT